MLLEADGADLLGILEDGDLIEAVSALTCDPDTGFAPGLDVTISTARYQCDANTMLRISDDAVTRDQWDSTCRIR